MGDKTPQSDNWSTCIGPNQVPWTLVSAGGPEQSMGPLVEEPAFIPRVRMDFGSPVPKVGYSLCLDTRGRHKPCPKGCVRHWWSPIGGLTLPEEWIRVGMGGLVGGVGGWEGDGIGDGMSNKMVINYNKINFEKLKYIMSNSSHHYS